MAPEESKKVATVKLFNKGKRVIQTKEGDLAPEKVMDIPVDEAKRLTRLFEFELIIVGENQSGQDASDQADAKKATEDKLPDDEDSDMEEDDKKSPESESIEITEDEINAMPKEALKAFISENGLDIQYAPNIKVGDLRKKIIDHLFEEE